ncbi:hypothetical protein [Nocardioides conyzicola]|uniref:Uncharacterized protein n=1 Tax=Nocardioides conyzicola TaxID=1651781 RepID=A0ABP8XFR4_9ACTN
MRRTLLVVLGLALLGLPPVLPAGADDTAPVTEVWRAGMPDGLTFTAIDCAKPETSSIGPYYFYSDDSLVLTASDTTAVGLSFGVASLSSLSAFEPTVTTGLGDPVRVQVSIPSREITGSALVPGAYIHHWATTDVFADVFFDWYDGHGGQTRSTLADYITGHAEASEPASISLAGGCAPGTADGYQVSRLHLAVAGVDRVLEFKQRVTPWVVGDRELGITYGRQVTLRSIADGDGQPGTPFQLWGRPIRSKKERLITTATTDADGVATATVRPERSMRYRWRYAVPDDHPITTSMATIRVRVAAKVTLRLARTPRPGRPGVAVVTVAPCGGQQVSLRAVTASGHDGARLARTRLVGCRARLPFVVPASGVRRLTAIVSPANGVSGVRVRPIPLHLAR